MASATILLVDDDEVLRNTLAIILQEHGYDVTTAASVPEALKLISAGSYDVLLSDLHMPGKGDGLTVVSAMRHANPKAVTILLSDGRRDQASPMSSSHPIRMSESVLVVTRRKFILPEGPLQNQDGMGHVNASRLYTLFDQNAGGPFP
jgi:CheY-like chemotaxis protein